MLRFAFFTHKLLKSPFRDFKYYCLFVSVCFFLLFFFFLKVIHTVINFIIQKTWLTCKLTQWFVLEKVRVVWKFMSRDLMHRIWILKNKPKQNKTKTAATRNNKLFGAQLTIQSARCSTFLFWLLQKSRILVNFSLQPHLSRILR